MHGPVNWPNHVYNHSCESMHEIPDGTIATCVTSPPYFQLRDYGAKGQIGTEGTIDEYVARLVGVFREVRRVLRPDGTLWLNLGDTHAARRMGPHIPAKSLLGIPWRVALALQRAGWILRSEIIWLKPNATPSSVRDRCTSAHEMIFMFAKCGSYYADMASVRQPLKESSVKRLTQKSFASQKGGPKDYGNGVNPNRSARKIVENLADRYKHNDARMASQESANRIWDDPEACARILLAGVNLRNVWGIPTVPSKIKHAAMFPPEIPRRCILIGSRPGDVVLDPFMGSGTTAVVARKLARRWVGYELNPEYVEIIRKRVATDGDDPPPAIRFPDGFTQKSIFDDGTEVA